MENITEQKVEEILSNIKVSDKNLNLIESEILLRPIIIKGDKLTVSLQMKEGLDIDYKLLQKKCEEALEEVKNIKTAMVILTSHRPENHQIKKLGNIKKIIAIASGKGGVGKSTTAANLAYACSQQGLKIGIIDADVYGPSLHHIFGINDTKPDLDDKNKIYPIEAFGLKVISIGSLVDKDRAIIWRGPMVGKALHNLLYGSIWGEIDILFIDMPPGTGDTHITIAKTFPLDGALIVSTPQTVALLDVARSVDMFAKVNIPIIGLIENMAYFIDPKSGNKSYIFGKNGAKKFAKKSKIDFLGEIPIESAIREAADNGTPILKEQSPIANTYQNIAKQLIKHLTIKN
jgi:ATP-binding protein involved in chromosome partitioning